MAGTKRGICWRRPRRWRGEGWVLVCFDDGRLVLLRGFNKKTGKTPISDLDLADRRMKEVMK
jgi:phage-related protein